MEVEKLTVDQGSRLYTNGAQVVAVAANVFYYDNLGYALFAADDILRCQQWNGLNTGDILKYLPAKSSQRHYDYRCCRFSAVMELMLERLHIRFYLEGLLL